MRKIAAHFWLRPDGSVGKFPIITFDENNKIVEIRERDAFVEEASLLLVNGFLVPGLVDYNHTILPAHELSVLKMHLNKLFIQGIRVLGVSADVLGSWIKAKPENMVLLDSHNHEGQLDEPMGFGKIQVATNSLDELINLTTFNAKVLGVNHHFGTLEVGKSPGLLAISNLNYQTFCVDENSKLKGIL